MPSFDRLLVLTVLALAASTLSAPVGTDHSHRVVPTERGLVPAARGGVPGDVLSMPNANDVGETRADTDDRAPDEEDTSGTVEARGPHAYPDEEDAHLDYEHTESSIVQRRAAATTKTTLKPKPTKVSVPKPTKAKTTKAKTTAKATKTKPAKPTKVKTPAKPTKTAKITTRPAKTPTAKATSKGSKTTKVTGTAAPSACPIKKPAKKPRAFITRAYDYFARLFARDAEEFIGWHGTNSDTAAFWAKEGQIKRPVKVKGGKKVTAGTSKADEQLGPGLYVSDDMTAGFFFANTNGNLNAGTTPKLCAIYAKSSQNWRIAFRKAFFDLDLVKDSENKEERRRLEEDRLKHIKQVMPGVHGPESVVKFSPLDRDKKILYNQMAIPESIASHFFAKCFDIVTINGQTAVAERDRAGTQTFPGFDYNSAALRTAWNIVPENGEACTSN